MDEEFTSLKKAVEDIQNGKLIIIVDDVKRENEGDFIGSAIKATPETINFMITHARGAFIALFCEDHWCKQMEIPPQVSDLENTEKNKTQMMRSIDSVNASSGSSASDRALTVNAFANPKSKPEDLRHPGHVIPIRADDNGLEERHGHTEAGVEIVKLAGFNPAVAVDLEILNESGEMASRDELFDLAEKFGISIISIQQLLDADLQHA